MLGRLLSAVKPKVLLTVPVPGSDEAELPLGTVKVRYEETRSSRSAPARGFGPPDDLELAIEPAAGGEPLELHPARSRNVTASGRSVRATVGSVEIAAPGRYRVSVTGTGERAYPRLSLVM